MTIKSLLVDLYGEFPVKTSTAKGSPVHTFGSKHGGLKLFDDTMYVVSHKDGEEPMPLMDRAILDGKTDEEEFKELLDEHDVELPLTNGKAQTTPKETTIKLGGELADLKQIQEHDLVYQYLKDTRRYPSNVIPESLKQGYYQDEGKKYTALVSLMIDEFNFVRCLEYTLLDRDNKGNPIKVAVRKKGESKGSTFFARRNDDSDVMIICEGTEDALSLEAHIPDVNVGACISAHYDQTYIPPHIKTVYLSRDNDYSGKEGMELFLKEKRWLNVYSFPAPLPAKDFGDVMKWEEKDNAYDLDRAQFMQYYDKGQIPMSERKLVRVNEQYTDYVPDISNKYIVESLITRRGLVSLGGMVKEGKSLLASQLAASVVNGTSFLNRDVVKQGGVFYFDSEPDIDRIFERFERQVGKDWKEKLRFNEPDGLSLFFDAYDYNFMVRELKREMDLRNPVLIIMDTMSDFLPKAEKIKINIYEYENERKRRIRNIAIEEQKTFVGITHTNQGNHSDVRNKFQGSTGNIAKEDLLLTLEKDSPTSKTGSLHIIGKDFSSVEELVELDEETLSWKSYGVKEEKESRKERIMNNVEALVMNNLGVEGYTVKLSDIKKNFDEADHENVAKDVQSLTKTGRLTKVRKGHYTMKGAS